MPELRLYIDAKLTAGGSPVFGPFSTRATAEQALVALSARPNALGAIIRDPNAGVAEPTVHVAIRPGPDQKPAVFADRRDAEAYAGGGEVYRLLICDGELATRMIAETHDDPESENRP